MIYIISHDIYSCGQVRLSDARQKSSNGYSKTIWTESVSLVAYGRGVDASTFSGESFKDWGGGVVPNLSLF